METSGPKVLAAGIARDLFATMAPILGRSELQVDHVPTLEASLALTGSVAFEVVVFGASSGEVSLTTFVRTLRGPKSASCRAAVLILATNESVEEARSLLNNGVNRVMLANDPPQVICEQIASLLKVAPRIAARLTTRLNANLGSGVKTALCQTANLSSTGMLLRTQRLVALGELVDFEINLGDETNPVRGKGKVVRHTRPNREGLEGIGVQFVDFGSGSKERLRVFLSKRGSED